MKLYNRTLHGVIFGLSLMLCSCGGGGTSSSEIPANNIQVSYFVGLNEDNTYALWKSDGTSTGTNIVKCISPGNWNSSYNYLAPTSNGLFFLYQEGSFPSLWYSDGTEAGTVKLTDPISGLPEYAVVDGIFYFSNYDPVSGEELWKSDGTASGTMLLKDLGAGSSFPSHLTNVNGTLFFTANEFGIDKPWISDGTEAGTVMLKDVRVLSDFVAVGNKVFFQGYDSASGVELWVSDGTDAGTHIVKDINPLTASSNPYRMVSYSGQLFFSADDGVSGFKVWKSDGSDAGTVLADDVFTVGTGNLTYLVATDSNLFFTMTDSSDGSIALWGTDGTVAGSQMLKTLYPGEVTSIDNYSFFAYKDKLYFVAWNNVGPRWDVWVSDGTVAGTNVLTDLNGIKYDIHPNINTGFGTNVVFLEFLTAADDIYLGFGAQNTSGVTHLWQTDGTESGTLLLKDIYGSSFL